MSVARRPTGRPRGGRGALLAHGDFKRIAEDLDAHQMVVALLDRIAHGCHALHLGPGQAEHGAVFDRAVEPELETVKLPFAPF